MTASARPPWTIDQLEAQAAVVLSVEGNGAPNGRVREIPDRRTIRYYTTLGLLDRPAEMRGRTAFYGRRHLLQLVAIKRLQARGLSLAEVQQQLVGVNDEALERLAELPAGADLPAFSLAAPPEEAPPPDRRSENFWSAAPAPPSAEPAAAPPDEADEPAVAIQGVRLNDGVTLLLEAARPIHEDDLSALRTAAAPLFKVLLRRRLIRPRRERGSP